MVSTRSGIIFKTLNNKVRRMVCTTPTKAHNVTATNVVMDTVPASTCPFRTAMKSMDEAMRPGHRDEVTPPSTKSELKHFDDIPGPKGLPIVGTLFDYMKKDGFKFAKMFEAYQQRALDHGPIYKEQIATIKTVVISDPEEYSKVIRAEGRYPQRREMEPMAYYRQQKGIDLGLVNDQGENWHKLRTVTAPKMLKLKEALQFCEPMNEVANDFVHHLTQTRDSQDEIVGLEKELFKWAFESIGTFLFEERVGCFADPTPGKAQEFLYHLQEYFKYLQPLMYNVPIYKLYRTKLWKTFEHHADKCFELGKYFIDKKAAELAAKEQSGEVDTENVSFLTYMLSQKTLTSSEALSTSVDLLQAATETTSNAMLWTLYCLAENPAAQEAMYQESKSVLGDESQITKHNIAKLQYVKAVVKETFRRYPITWATSRILQEELEVAGYRLPAGTHVQANLFGMFRDETLFPDNSSFKPERWLRSSDMDTTQKSMSNLIWGHGARMCIGRRFAEQEMHIALTKIVQNFRLEYHHEPIEPTLNTVMTPDRPVILKFIPRNNH